MADKEVDLEALLQSFDAIKVQSAKFDEAIEAKNTEIQRKAKEFAALEKERNRLAMKRAAVSKQLELYSSNGVYQTEARAERQVLRAALNDIIEESAETAVEKKKLELMQDHFRNKRLAVVNEQRMWTQQIQECILQGPLGRKLNQMKAEICDLREASFASSIADLKRQISALENQANHLKKAGDKLETDSVEKTKQKANLEAKLNKLKLQTKTLDNRLAAFEKRRQKLQK